jgi:hypothetical protein
LITCLRMQLKRAEERQKRWEQLERWEQLGNVMRTTNAESWRRLLFCDEKRSSSSGCCLNGLSAIPGGRAEKSGHGTTHYSESIPQINWRAANLSPYVAHRTDNPLRLIRSRSV